ncbi:condensation domain-containing protein [Streptomyces jeddahensis]|nr:condensation domain-containing protein [Streptomyces jeddahensis]
MILPLHISIPGSNPEEMHRRSKQALEGILGRHEGLRTTISLSPDGYLSQQVNGFDTYELPLLEVSEKGFTEECRKAAASLTSPRFNLAEENPMRARLVTCDSAGVLILAIHHVAADAASIEVLEKDFKDTLSSGTFSSARPMQPRDLAAYEQSPHGVAHRARSIEYLRRCAASSPTSIFPDTYDSGGRFAMTTSYCPEVFDSAHAAARALKVSVQSIWLAALALYLRTQLGAPVSRILTHVSNRIIPGSLDSVANLARIAPIVLPLDGRADFESTAKLCLKSTMRAMYSGLSSSRDYWQSKDKHGANGEQLRDEVYYNYIPARVAGSRPGRTVRLETVEREKGPTFELQVIEKTSEIQLSVAISQCPDPESVVRWIESCIVGVARNPGISLQGLRFPESRHIPELNLLQGEE